MVVSLGGLGLFLFAFTTHLVIWRFKRPARHTRSLLIMFFGVLPVGLWGIGRYLEIDFRVLDGVLKLLHISVFHSVMSLSYIATYSGIEEDSPSCAIVRLVHVSGDRGCERKEFEVLMNNENLVAGRLRTLIRDGLIREEDGAYYVTPKGKTAAKVFLFAQKVLGIEMGG